MTLPSARNAASRRDFILYTCPMSSADLVREFWRLMNSNDFYSIAKVVSPDFVVEWPQTNERIRGVANFGTLNAEYPSHGRWIFNIHRLVNDQTEVVTDVTFTDSVQSVRVISFFTVQNGTIDKIVEYWPDSYTPPANRSHLTEPLHN